MAQPKGFFKEGGKTKPRFEKKGIKESDMRISVKGNNDTITVGTKKSTGGMKGNRELVTNFKGYNPDDDAFNHYHRKLEADYLQYKELQKRTKLPKLNLDEYKIAYGYWNNLSEDKRRNVISTVTGRKPEKIKFVNYKFNDLSHKEQNACLILGKGYNYTSFVSY